MRASHSGVVFDFAAADPEFGAMQASPTLTLALTLTLTPTLTLTLTLTLTPSSAPCRPALPSP